MAAGSHKTYGSWETRVCAVCDVKLTLAHSHAMHVLEADGRAFSLCGDHISSYGLVRSSA